MKRKHGISLIVLVITIIVMIILAAAVVVSLNNTGIIGKANTAVSKTNLKQIESLASLAWADAFMDGARTQSELKTAVDEALKDVDTSKYTIIVTESGVTVTEGASVAKVLKPGLYTTGAIAAYENGGVEAIENMLVYTWEEAVAKGYLTVTDGVLTHTHTSEVEAASPAGSMDGTESSTWAVAIAECDFAGDLFLPTDGSIKEIGEWAFDWCVGITGIRIPDSVTKINNSAFRGSSGLAKVNIPTSITYIGVDAFESCGIKGVVLPDTITEIGNGAFDGATSMGPIGGGYDVEYPISLTTMMIDAIGDYSGIKTVEIHSGITEIPASAFTGKRITKVIIPATVTTIGESAFNDCSWIEVVEFKPNSGLTTIERSAFDGTSSLVTITLPSTVTIIGTYAFLGSGVTTFNFAGTVSQWNAISKSSGWNSSTSFTQIICSDGTVTL